MSAVYKVRPKGEVLGRDGDGVRRRGGVAFGRVPVKVSTVEADGVTVVSAEDLARILADPYLVCVPVDGADGGRAVPPSTEPGVLPRAHEGKAVGLNEFPTPTGLHPSARGNTPGNGAVAGNGPASGNVSTGKNPRDDPAAEEPGVLPRADEGKAVGLKEDADEEATLRAQYEAIYDRKPHPRITLEVLRDKVENPDVED